MLTSARLRQERQNMSSLCRLELHVFLLCLLRASFCYVHEPDILDIVNGGAATNSELFTQKFNLDLPDVSVVEGHLFKYQIPTVAFENRRLVVQLTEVGKPTLPSWMYFNQSSHTLAGIPVTAGQFYIQVDLKVYTGIVPSKDVSRGNSDELWSDALVTNNFKGGQHRTEGLLTNGFIKKEHLVVTDVFRILVCDALTSCQSIHSQPQSLQNFQESPKIPSTSSPSSSSSFSSLIQPDCPRDVFAYSANIVLDVELAELPLQRRMKLVGDLASFVQIPVEKITLNEYRGMRGMTVNQELVILMAGPGNVQNGVPSSSGKGALMSWPISCGEFRFARDFSQVLDHNVAGGRITSEISFNVIGWHITAFMPTRSGGQKKKRTKRQLNQATPFPGTPSISMAQPTRLTLLSTISETLSTDMTSSPQPPVLTSSTSTVVSASSLFDSSVFSASSSEDKTVSTDVTPLLPSTSESVPEGPSQTITLSSIIETSSLVDQSSDSSFEFSTLILSSSVTVDTSSSIDTVVTSSSTTTISVTSTLVFNVTTVTPAITTTVTTEEETTTEITTTTPAATTTEPETTTEDEITTTEAKTTTVVETTTELDTTMMPTTTTEKLTTEVNTTISAPTTTVTVEDTTTVEDTSTVKPTTTTEGITTSTAATTTENITEAVTTATTKTQTDTTTANITDEFTTEAVTTPYLTTEAATTTLQPTTGVTVALNTTVENTTAAALSTTEIFTTEAVTNVTTDVTTMLPAVTTATTIATTEATTTSPTKITTEQITTTTMESLTTSPVTTSLTTTESITTPATTATTPSETTSEVITTSTEGATTSEATTESITSEGITTTTTAALTTTKPTTPTLTTDKKTTAETTTTTKAVTRTFEITTPKKVTTTTSETTTAPSTTVSPTVAMTTAKETTTVMTTTLPPSTTVQTTTVEITTVPVNQAPILYNQFDNLQVYQGEYFSYLVPRDTFHDREDGDTRHLNLSLLDSGTGEVLGPASWVLFNEPNQIIYGVPVFAILFLNPQEFYLMAEDSGGLFSTEVFNIFINSSSVVDISHVFVISLEENYLQFVNDTQNLITVMQKIGNFFGDSDSRFVTVVSVTNGSVNVAWSNNSFSKLVCQNESIHFLLDEIIDPTSGNIKSNFSAAMLPEFRVLSVQYRPLGVCVPGDVLPPIVSVGAVAIDNYYIYLVTIIPAVGVVLILLLIGLIVCILYRRRRDSGDRLVKADKPTYNAKRGKRKPVILPEELELQEVDRKPKKPLFLLPDSDPLMGGPATRPPAERPHPPPPPQYHVPQFDFDWPDQGDQTTPPPSYHSGSGRGPHRPPPPAYRLPPPYLAEQGDSSV